MPETQKRELYESERLKRERFGMRQLEKECIEAEEGQLEKLWREKEEEEQLVATKEALRLDIERLRAERLREERERTRTPYSDQQALPSHLADSSLRQGMPPPSFVDSDFGLRPPSQGPRLAFPDVSQQLRSFGLPALGFAPHGPPSFTSVNGNQTTYNGSLHNENSGNSTIRFVSN